MTKYLVVYYSRTGATHRVAKYLADQLGAELDEIDDASTRLGAGGYVRSALEALAKGVPAIHTRCDPSAYDRVIVGTPVWVGTMSSPVRSYLLAHRGQLHPCALFAVMGGRGGAQAVREMKLACGGGDVPTMVLRQSEVEQACERSCDAFLDAIRKLPPNDAAHRSASQAAPRP